jgi:RNA polymerase sigma factor (sigma-70 family)
MSTQDKENRRAVHLIAAEMFAQKYSYLLRIARWNSRCEPDAADALQEAFAAFIATYAPERGSPPLAWLTLTLKRTCWRLKERREVAVEPLALAEVFGGATPDPLDRIASSDGARRRLGALKPDERRAIVLHAAGYTYGEIGKRCGWSHTKVNRCLYEGRRALKGGD